MINNVHFNGKEEFGIVCCECGKEESIGWNEVRSYIDMRGLYEGEFRCQECYAARKVKLNSAIEDMRGVQEKYPNLYEFSEVLKALEKAIDDWHIEAEDNDYE